MKGSYILLFELDACKEIAIGKLGRISFPKASYAYIGSGMNGIEARVTRHFRQDKKLRWHIDYLSKEAEIEEAIFCPAKRRIECTLAQALIGELEYIAGFGCSDCKCRSHLYFASDLDTLRMKITKAIKQLGLAGEIFFQVDRTYGAGV